MAKLKKGASEKKRGVASECLPFEKPPHNTQSAEQLCSGQGSLITAHGEPGRGGDGSRVTALLVLGELAAISSTPRWAQSIAAKIAALLGVETGNGWEAVPRSCGKL